MPHAPLGENKIDRRKDNGFSYTRGENDKGYW